MLCVITWLITIINSDSPEIMHKAKTDLIYRFSIDNFWLPLFSLKTLDKILIKLHKYVKITISD